MIEALFLLFGLIAIASALGVVLMRNPLMSALSLVGALCSIAAIFVLYEAYLIAVFQVLLYAGAITVLFIFVVMVVQFSSQELKLPRLGVFKMLALLLSASLGGLIVWTWWSQSVTGKAGAHPLNAIVEEGGDVQALSQYLFSHYALPFEVASVILLIAIVGSVVLAQRPKKSPKELIVPAGRNE